MALGLQEPPHELDELRQMKKVRFAVVHYTPPVQNLVSLFETDGLPESSSLYAV